MKKLSVVLVVLGVVACVTVPLPAAKWEQSQASIRAAEEMGAQAVPEARLHLQLAKEQTETAKQMALNGDDRAELLLARAEVDAELALGLARESSLRAAAIAAREDLKAIQARGNP